MIGLRISILPRAIASGTPVKTFCAQGPRFSGAFDVFQRELDHAAKLEALQKKKEAEAARLIAEQAAAEKKHKKVQAQLETKKQTLQRHAELEQQQLKLLTEPLLNCKGKTLNGADILDIVHNLASGGLGRLGHIAKTVWSEDAVWLKEESRTSSTWDSGWDRKPSTLGTELVILNGIASVADTISCLGFYVAGNEQGVLLGWAFGLLGAGLHLTALPGMLKAGLSMGRNFIQSAPVEEIKLSRFLGYTEGQTPGPELEEALNKLVTAGLLLKEKQEYKFAYFGLTLDGKKLLQFAEKNKLGLVQQNIEDLNAKALAVHKELSSPGVFPLAKGSENLSATREQQVSALLGQNAWGLTGFNTLKKVQELLNQRYFQKQTFSQAQLLTHLQVKPAEENPLSELYQAGYLKYWGGKESNPKYRLTESAQALVAYESIGALKKAGKITKADEKGFLQGEIDMWQGQHRANETWLAQLEETHAQTSPHSTTGEDREAVVKERQNQLEMGRNFAKKNQKAIGQAIAELSHSLDLLDLNEVNVQLRELSVRPEQVAQEIQKRLGTILRENQEEYFTNQALLSPEKQQAQMNVEERIQERLLANATAKAAASLEPTVITENTVAIPSSKTLKIPAQPMAQSQQS